MRPKGLLKQVERETMVRGIGRRIDIIPDGIAVTAALSPRGDRQQRAGRLYSSRTGCG